MIKVLLRGGSRNKWGLSAQKLCSYRIFGVDFSAEPCYDLDRRWMPLEPDMQVKYDKIANGLRQDILCGKYRHRLPSEVNWHVT